MLPFLNPNPGGVIPSPTHKKLTISKQIVIKKGGMNVNDLICLACFLSFLVLMVETR
jgi:hypothetical protein